MSTSKRLPAPALVSAVLLALAIPAFAADAPSAQPARVKSILVAPLVKDAPALDGKLDDKAWQQAQPLKGWSFRPKGIRYQTEGFLCRDADNLYVAARCFDDNLGELVTKNEAEQIWRNDCIEIFIVPDKKTALFTHIVVDCAGKASGSVWGVDKWKEPVEGKGLELKAKVGREKDAWTVEVAIPLKPFGIAITEKSVWAFGLNREKHSYPEENSSFQGGFNQPAEYPDLVFDNRTILFDGIGVKNVGGEKAIFNVKVSGGGKEGLLKQELAPGASAAIDYQSVTGRLDANQDLSLQVMQTPGMPPPTETYLMVEGAKPIAKIDPKAMPEAKFKPGPMDDPNFFPIAAWAQPAGAAWVKALKEMGVNVYFSAPDSYPNPKGKEFLDILQANGMYAILDWKPEYVEKEYHKHPAAIGWMHGDEPDQPKAGGQTATAEELLADYLKMRAPQPSLRVFMNLGQGVANDRYGARVAYSKYPDYCKAADAISYDIYPCNSLGADGPERLCVVAKGVERLVQWTDGKKPIWFVIEVNRFTAEKEKDSRAPTPEEVKTQVWMAITEGARGLCLFCHSWYKGFSCSRIEPDMQKALKGIFAEVHSLAPVINSPTVADGASAQCEKGGMVGTLCKKEGGATYVFAVNMFKKADKATLTVRGAADGSAEVLFENRTVPVKGGVIVDDFEPYAVHRYKIGK